MKRRHTLPFGAELLPDGAGARFRLWAPGAQDVELALEQPGGASRRLPMEALPDGWHAVALPAAGAGSRYRYVIDGERAVPDPASRCNPDDVQGASLVVDAEAYDWQDGGWRGRPWHEAVVYELHVGCFTPEGSYAAAAERLPELAALGITAVELLPLADFPGARGWGYDGVLPFAPDASYGTPEDLKRFIDRAHALGLMVLLDVVYNHFGPEGNFLHAYCPAFFNPRHQTPWGAAINFDGAGHAPVRDFVVHNALYWVEEFHLDGLRLDAVHAIRDDSPRHIVAAIAAALQGGPGRQRHVHLVLENEANEAHHLGRANAASGADAQWNDDLHHAAHVFLTGETDGYYADHADAPLARLGRCLAEGFDYQGQPSPLRGGAPRGEPSAHLPPTAFVSFLQNHDQIGNRAFGERIGTLVVGDAARRRTLDTLYACLLLSPQVPMLFMGEEWDASTPFLYFCDFQDERLADAVREGRRAEFKRFKAFKDAAARARIPDPSAASTFLASKLRWDEREQDPHAERLALIGRLLALRRDRLVPRLADARGGGRWRLHAGEVLQLEWPLGDDGARWQLVAHFGTLPAPMADDGDAARWHQVLPLAPESPALLSPGAVRVRLRDGAGG